MKIGNPVAMDEVPKPGIKLRHNKCRELYEAIGALRRGTALPVEFSDKHEADVTRAMVRKLAQKDGEFMSSSQSEGALIVYFWLEPVDVAKALRRAA